MDGSIQNLLYVCITSLVGRKLGASDTCGICTGVGLSTRDNSPTPQTRGACFTCISGNGTLTVAHILCTSRHGCNVTKLGYTLERGSAWGTIILLHSSDPRSLLHYVYLEILHSRLLRCVCREKVSVKFLWFKFFEGFVTVSLKLCSSLWQFNVLK